MRTLTTGIDTKTTININHLSTRIKPQLVFKLFSIKKILMVIDVWCQRAAMRHQLAQLPAYRLQDMGISVEDALAELQKPFWQR